MRTGESGEHQLPRIRMTLMHLNSACLLDSLRYFRKIGEVQIRLNAESLQIQRKRHNIHIAGALAVSEQSAFDAFRAREQSHLGRGDGAPLVVVRMHADRGFVQIRITLNEIGDHIRVVPRRTPLDGRGKIEDEVALFRLAPRLFDRNAEIDDEVDIAVRELLGGEFISDHILHSRLFHKTADEFGSLDRHPLDLLARFAENDLTVQIGGCNVRMKHGGVNPLEGFDSAADQGFPHLGQNADADVSGNVIVLDQLAGKLKIILRRGREGNFDFLESDIGKKFEIFKFFRRIHRHGKSLIAVAQIDGAPSGSMSQLSFDPIPFFQRNACGTLILWSRHNTP